MRVVGAVRYVVGTFIMTASAPNYILLWTGWKGVSLMLPSWVYQAGDDFLYSMYQRMVLFFFEHCTALKVYISGDVDQVLAAKENVLYLSNHQSTVDWVVCDILAVRQNSIGHLRYVMKDTLQMLPLYGFYFYQHGCIYVKRGDFKQKKMEQALQYLTNKNIQSWVVMFPEGTRYIPEQSALISKSKQIAEKSGFKPLDHHLTPRYKGTYLALSHLRSSLDAVYDVTVVYSGSMDERGQRKKAPQLIDFLLGKSPEMHIHVRRIPIDEVPEQESEFKSWMHELFIYKDQFSAGFYEAGHAQMERGKLSPLPFSSTLPSLLFFVLSFVPFYFLPKLGHLYWQALLIGSIGGYTWLMAKAVC